MAQPRREFHAPFARPAARDPCRLRHDQTSMPYTPTVQVQPVAAAGPVVAVSEQVANLRRAGREDAMWIGTIRGGYGNPLKRLHSDVPVDQVVAQAFAAGLAARGLHAPGGGGAWPSLIAVPQHQFDANQRLEMRRVGNGGRSPWSPHD